MHLSSIFKAMLLSILMGTTLSYTKTIQQVTATQISKEIQTYGEQIHGLSYQLVRDALLSKKVTYKNWADLAYPPKDVTQSHPYGDYLLTERIMHANATDDEKLKLWNLFLYTKICHYSYTKDRINPHNLLNKRIETPTQLFKSIPARLTFFDKIKTICTGTCAMGLLGAGLGYLDVKIRPTERRLVSITWVGEDGFYRDPTTRQFFSFRRNPILQGPNFPYGSIPQNRNAWDCALGSALLAATCTATLMGVSMFTPPPIESRYIKNFETLKKDHFAVVHWLKNVLPKSILDSAQQLEKELAELTYRDKDKHIDHDMFQHHYEIFCDYHVTLGELADIENIS